MLLHSDDSVLLQISTSMHAQPIYLEGILYDGSSVSF